MIRQDGVVLTRDTQGRNLLSRTELLAERGRINMVQREDEPRVGESTVIECLNECRSSHLH